MRLMGQFNLIFVLVLGLAVGVDYVVFNSFFQESAQKEVLEHAKLMLQTSMSIRKYTSAQIDPVIKSLDPNSIRKPFLATRRLRTSTICERRIPVTPTAKPL